MIDAKQLRLKLKEHLAELEESDHVEMGRDDYNFLSGQIVGISDAIKILDAEMQKEKEDHVHKTKLRLEREEFIMSKGRKL